MTNREIDEKLELLINTQKQAFDAMMAGTPDPVDVAIWKEASRGLDRFMAAVVLKK